MRRYIAVMIRSPCTNVCRIEARTGWCEGCARTVDEIMRWPSASDDERLAVIAALPARAERRRRKRWWRL